MINTMPALTDEQREELINHNLAKINAITPQYLKEKLPGVKRHLQCEIDSAKIALAALTAEPVAYISEMKLKTLSQGIHSVSVRPDPVMVRPHSLYTAPPFPALKLPARMNPGDDCMIQSHSWNVCIDEVKRLNGVTK